MTNGKQVLKTNIELALRTVQH